VRSPLRRLAAALSVTTLLAAGAVTAALPATASSTTAAAACRTSLDLPGRVSIDRPLHQARIAINDRCGVDQASFQVVGPKGYSTTFDFDLTRTDKYARWDIPSTLAPGTYTARSATPGYAPTTAVLKYGSKISFAAYRFYDEPGIDSNVVYMEACASYYNASRGQYLPWRDHRVVLENTDRFGGYRYLSTVRTGADGCALTAVPNKYLSTYRVTSYETANIFSRTSAGITI